MITESPFARPRGSPSIHRHVLLLQSWWEERVLRGVGRYAAEHRWVLDSSMRWHHRLPPQPWSGDGIIAYCGMGRPNKDIIDFARKSKVPVVETQGTELVPNAGRVQISNERIARTGAEHLLSLNFKHLGFVTFEENAMELPRRLAFRQTVEAAGARFYALTYANLIAEITSLPRPMGLMATNDANAVNVCLALTDAGLKVPEEYAVLGVDDTEIVCELAPVPLSSVNCNYEQQGYEAAALLDRLMNGENAAAAPLIIEPRGVTVRRSTDAVALPDLDSARFLRYLRDHYLDHLTLGVIAGDLGVSLRKVQTIFQQYLGHSMLDEMTRLRVEHSKKLLLNPKLKIETVGVESGFSNRFHFIRAFQRVTGQTPKEYRKRLNEGQGPNQPKSRDAAILKR
jgi:LacI family transcriptional regulator